MAHFMKATTGGVLRNFAKFTGKHRCQILFFNKVEDISIPPENIRKPFSDVFRVFRKAYKFMKKKLWHRYFLVDFAKFLGTLSWNTSGQLLLHFKQKRELSVVWIDARIFLGYCSCSFYSVFFPQFWCLYKVIDCLRVYVFTYITSVVLNIMNCTRQFYSWWPKKCC